MDQFTYYMGYSLTDTIMANEVRKLTYKLATEGKVYLVQKRDIEQKGAFWFTIIKASTPPVHKLVPFTDEKRTELLKPHRVSTRKGLVYEYRVD